MFRRAHGYKTQNEFEKAIKDLEDLIKVEPKNPQAKKEMIELKTKVRAGEPATPIKVAKGTPGAPKIQEVDSGSKKEELEVSKLEETPVKVKKVVTKNLDEDTRNKASEIASLEANEAALKTIPKTSAGFEKDFNQLKKDSSNVYQYLR